MSRKQFLALLVAIPCAGQGILQASKAEQEFASTFNAWATAGNQNGATVDAKEIRLWHETTHAWNRLKHQVEQSYK